MDDTLDVLNVSRDGEPAPKKKSRVRAKRPEGLSREAYSLLDGSHPVVQTLPLKKRPARKEGPNKKRKGDVSYTVSYKWKAFRNEARSDALELKRWVKCFTDRLGNFREVNPAEYPFAKLNKQPEVFKYSDLEWEKCLSRLSVDWSQEETLYFLELCRQFSLRFPVIHDRYSFEGSARSYDDLKERYYSMAHALACFRSGEELPTKYLQKHPYDAAYERRRREAARAVMEMTWEEEWRDNTILEQAERIEAQRLEGATITQSATSEDDSDLTVSPAAQGQEQWETLPLHDAQGGALRPEPGIYIRGRQVQSLLPEPTDPTEQKVMQEFSMETCFPTVRTQKLMKSWIDLHNDVRVLSRLRETVESNLSRQKL